MKFKSVIVKIWVETITIQNKPSMTRWGGPAQYYLRFCIQGENGGTTIIREEIFTDKKLFEDTRDNWRNSLK